MPLRRALAPRPTARSLAAPVLAALALSGCAGRSPVTLAADSRAATPATVLTCVAEVAAEAGLPVIERRPEGETPVLRARSAAPTAAGPEARSATGGQPFDVLVVTVGRAGRRLRALAQTFLPPRPDAPVGSDGAAHGTLWQSGAPSARVARARDAVLDRCSTLGD